MNSATISVFLSTSPSIRTRSRRDRRAKLVSILRQVAYLTSLQAYDEPQLHQRCALARLVAAVDEGLRSLVNEDCEQ